MASTIKKPVEKNHFDSHKFIDQANQVQQNAKTEIISLLREYVEGGQIVPTQPEYASDYWLWAWEGNWHHIQMYAYGLNDKGELCFKAWDEDLGKDDYENGEWCEFEEHFITDQYHKVYELVVDHILGELEDTIVK